MNQPERELAEKPTIFLVSGLPRAGSTLLCNVLAQNPRVAVTATSGLLEVLNHIRTGWHQWIEMRAMDPNERIERLQTVLHAATYGYFAREIETGARYIFDKSRGWNGYLPLAQFVLGYKPKVLVPVRDVRDVLASFELLYRKNAHTPTPPYLVDYFKAQTVPGRCEILMRNDQPVGLAYNRIQNALQTGRRHRPVGRQHPDCGGRLCVD